MNERSDELILVDQRDAVVGYAGTGECHDGAGLLQYHSTSPCGNCLYLTAPHSGGHEKIA